MPSIYDATPPTQLPMRRPVPTIIEQGAATPRTYLAARPTTQAPSPDRHNDDNTPVLSPLPQHNTQSLHRVRHHSHYQYMCPLQRRRCLQDHLRHQPAPCYPVDNPSTSWWNHSRQQRASPYIYSSPSTAIWSIKSHPSLACGL